LLDAGEQLRAELVEFFLLEGGVQGDVLKEVEGFGGMALEGLGSEAEGVVAGLGGEGGAGGIEEVGDLLVGAGGGHRTFLPLDEASISPPTTIRLSIIPVSTIAMM